MQFLNKPILNITKANHGLVPSIDSLLNSPNNSKPSKVKIQLWRSNNKINALLNNYIIHER